MPLKDAAFIPSDDIIHQDTCGTSLTGDPEPSTTFQDFHCHNLLETLNSARPHEDKKHDVNVRWLNHLYHSDLLTFGICVVHVELRDHFDLSDERFSFHYLVFHISNRKLRVYTPAVSLRETKFLFVLHSLCSVSNSKMRTVSTRVEP